jgi:hypothetical protein
VEDWRRMETEREKKERSEEAERKIREEELREEKIRAKAASILKKLRGDQVPAEEDAMIIRSEYSALLERLKVCPRSLLSSFSGSVVVRDERND